MLLPERGETVAPVQQTFVRNGLLRAMSVDDFALLAPHLQPIATQLREELVTANQSITECYFPESGCVSVVAAHMEREVEVGLIGREGLVGATPVLLGENRTPHTSYVQLSGELLGIAAPALLAAFMQSSSLHRLLLLYVQTHIIQIAQTTFAQTILGLESRLARWLLMCHDRVDGDEVLVTHEFLSVMLGVQRAGVTLALQNLEGAGRISSRRKRIQILDRDRLEELTAGTYGVPEAEYRRLIGAA